MRADTESLNAQFERAFHNRRLPAWGLHNQTVIAVSFFESIVGDHSKDHPVAITASTATRSTEPVHHSAGRN